jgi:hypothetical protein
MVREGGVEPPRAFAHWILSPARLPVSPLSRVCDYESLPGYRLCSLAPAADRKSPRAVRRARGGRCCTGRVSRSARWAALAEWPRRGGELIDILRASILSVRRTRYDPSPAVRFHTSSVDLFGAESILGCFGFLDAERAVVPKREKPAIRPARLPVVFPTSAQKKAECQSQKGGLHNGTSISLTYGGYRLTTKLWVVPVARSLGR